VSPRVLVAGIGNIFLGDDGFGVEVARLLAARPQPEGIAVMDVGVRALHLAYALLDKPELLIVIDAVDRGAAPGSLFVIEPEIADASSFVADGHGMNLETVLGSLRILGGEIPRVRLVGCQPEFIGERMSLSPAVQRVVSEAAVLIETTIAKTLGSRRENAAAAAEETA
jgi:hydrogenase maturation protease